MISASKIDFAFICVPKGNSNNSKLNDLMEKW